MTYEQLYTMVGIQDRHGKPVYLSLLKKAKDDRNSNNLIWKYENRNVEELLPLNILIGGEKSSYIIIEIDDETVKKLHTLKNAVPEFIGNTIMGNPTQEDMKSLKDHIELTAFYLFDAPNMEDIDGYYGG